MPEYRLRMARREQSGQILHIIEDEIISALTVGEAIEKANTHNVAVFDDSDVAWLTDMPEGNILWVRTIGDKPRA